MIELEPIGPMKRLAPGESGSFEEIWELHPLPFGGKDSPADLDSIRELGAGD